MDVALDLVKVVVHCVLIHLGADGRVDGHAGLLWAQF